MSMVSGVHVYRDGALVFAPGQAATSQLVVENRGDGPARVAYTEDLPAGWRADGPTGLAHVELRPGQRAETSLTLVAPQIEGPALLAGTFTVEREGAKAVTFRLETPIACYKPHPVDAPEHLAAVRDRLVAVTNFHPRCGHELMLDPRDYFTARLNAPLSEALARLVARDFNFAQVGIPVAREVLLAVRWDDNKGVLGVHHILLKGTDDPCDTVHEPRHAAAYPKTVRS